MAYSHTLRRWLCPACHLAEERSPTPERPRVASGVTHAINPAHPARRHAAAQRRPRHAAVDDEDRDDRKPE